MLPPPDQNAETAAARARFFTLEIVLGAAVFLVAFAAFFYLARTVFGQPSVALDAWAFALADRCRAAAPGLTPVVYGVTFFGSLLFFVPASLLAPWWMRRRGYGRHALALLLAMGGGWALNEGLKAYFQRPRPTSALLYQYGLSFPSGHAMMSMAFYGCLAWLLAREYGRRGWAVGLLVWAVLVGLTRVYLHVHYLTDVLAGYAGGLAWLLFVIMNYKLLITNYKVGKNSG